mgnify:CR=1 FL=1
MGCYLRLMLLCLPYSQGKWAWACVLPGHSVAHSQAAPLPSDPTGVFSLQGKLPSLQPGQYWPGGGALVSIPASALPAMGECQPWNLTLAINSTFAVISGSTVNQTSQQVGR